jgi:hypothetical protein
MESQSAGRVALVTKYRRVVSDKSARAWKMDRLAKIGNFLHDVTEKIVWVYFCPYEIAISCVLN